MIDMSALKDLYILVKDARHSVLDTESSDFSKMDMHCKNTLDTDFRRYEVVSVKNLQIQI